MTKFNKLQTLLQANSVFAMFTMMGFHCTMSVGTDGCTHVVDVTVFWDDDNQRRYVMDNSRGLLRDGDGRKEDYHQNADLQGGWTQFNFYFE